jgi:hypothetical protein
MLPFAGVMFLQAGKIHIQHDGKKSTGPSMACITLHCTIPPSALPHLGEHAPGRPAVFGQLLSEDADVRQVGAIWAQTNVSVPDAGMWAVRPNAALQHMPRTAQLQASSGETHAAGLQQLRQLACAGVGSNQSIGSAQLKALGTCNASVNMVAGLAAAARQALPSNQVPSAHLPHTWSIYAKHGPEIAQIARTGAEPSVELRYTLRQELNVPITNSSAENCLKHLTQEGAHRMAPKTVWCTVCLVSSPG